MGTEQIVIIALGALAGGFVSGLAGFGTGITALGIWLHAVSPQVAASLVVICSVVAQLLTLPTIWRSIEPRRVLPFIVPGLIAVPFGTALLAYVDPPILKAAIGGFLLAFAAYIGLRHPTPPISWGGRWADGGVGLLGGLLGGLAGLSGALPTVWATIRGWSKTESRSLFQAFNASILMLAILAHWQAGLLTREVGWAVLAALPGTLIGAWVGARAYGRLSDRLFRSIVLSLIFISGCLLVWTNLLAVVGR